MKQVILHFKPNFWFLVKQKTILDEVLLMRLLFLCMLLKHLASILALPATVICFLPIALVSLFPYIPFWGTPYHAAMFLLVAGIGFSGLGFFLLYSTISLFIKRGNGTIAPQNPPKKLMVIGIYAHVRNPMHIGVFLILIGESFVVGSIALTFWTLLFIVGNLLYLPLIEERKLAERFGGEYLIYKKHVPRWIPRLSSWKSNSENQNAINTS
jgi:protein-S-isoprenylcysteine O-methyltransferase Ste14